MVTLSQVRLLAILLVVVTTKISLQSTYLKAVQRSISIQILACILQIAAILAIVATTRTS